ncbi:MAG: GatB/YqeY domain-containing protein [Candidatus Omnitrophica bacterium]|nr:GatB/YqeY domain-containing protein [Candidatus Omnitrophota bacterium]
MLEEKILEDFKQAMKEKDKVRSSILSFLRAQFKNAAIAEKKDKLDDAEVASVLRKEAKRHEDSIEQFKKGNRQDLVEKETKELEIIKTYLPKSLEDAQIKEIISQVLKEFPDATIKDMGKVMKQVMEKASGKAQGGRVSALVKQALTKSESPQE